MCFCGIASLAMVQSVAKGEFIDEDVIVTDANIGKEEEEKIRTAGVTLAQLQKIAQGVFKYCHAFYGQTYLHHEMKDKLIAAINSEE